MRNKIETLVGIKKLAEAYNAAMRWEVKSGTLEVALTMPDAGAQTPELVNCLCQELLGFHGIEAEVAGRQLTFTVE